MKRYTVQIDSENDAFVQDEALEIAGILRDLSDHLVVLGSVGLKNVMTLKDTNGVTVGEAGFVGEKRGQG